jgi:hypothetical protein
MASSDTRKKTRREMFQYTGVPGHHPSRLDDAFVGHKLNMTADNVSAETGKCASCLMADLSRSGFHDRAEARNLRELLPVG